MAQVVMMQLSDVSLQRFYEILSGKKSEKIKIAVTLVQLVPDL